MKSFATTAPIAAVLDIPAGRVQFIAADRSDTAVEVLPANAAKGRDVQAAERTSVEFTDGVLRINADQGSKVLGSSGAVEVTVQLPAGSRVEVKSAAVELRGVGRLGDVTFDGAQSAVKLDEAAQVRLTTQAGDVEIGRLTGPAEISTQSGDITVGTSASASLDAGTAFGRIHNSLKNTGTTELHIHATTGYGDITARSL
ncbi:hypothetical protein BBK82_13420 [Lentzea guizhouensis]|uniref:DUF4097 domain-containing protein n=1 Tax=Lentzea guizhouensis TaxID=1586287 RepID=A0A1B2HGT3_9PSEU|nr:DUF4097 family beta strand repeat-containing protein [Lentzea guizhouensis]ANZ36924.1 hypothetical protein BBK82_13420 [Lentzea guizhouensis]